MNSVLFLNSLVKLLTWLASPLGFLCAGVVLYAILRWRQRLPVLRRTILVIAITECFVFSLPITAFYLQDILEHRARQLAASTQSSLPPPYSAILVLGGVGSATLHGGELIVDYGESIDRVTYAAQLYKDGIAPLIIASGGSWPMLDGRKAPPPESALIKDLLIRLGVPAEHILEESASTTTRENLALTRQLLIEQGLNPEEIRLALVTSASHMPRSMMNAERAGFKVAAYPTDWESVGKEHRPWIMQLPDAGALEKSQKNIKELIGNLVAY